jgi:kinase-associated protein B
MMPEFQIGDKVTAIYKTGKYIGEITEERTQHYLVRVLAVLTHPMQGDLHHPKNASVDIFHERRALANREQTNVPKQMVKHFHDEIPNYQESLKAAVDKMKKECTEANSAWGEKSLENIEGLEKSYFK